MPANVFRAAARRALHAVLLGGVSLAAACGGGGSPTDPTASPAAPASLTLLAQLDLAALTGRAGSSGSGNWGYTAPSGRRFALTGTSAGLSVVDVSDPARPRSTGFIAGPDSTWREVRTYGEYAYVTTEAVHGLDIVDLRNPDQPRLVRTWNQTFNRAHSLWIDRERGLLFAHGTRLGNTRTGMRVLSLADPENPREVGDFQPFYIHDSFTRGTTMYAAAINDGFLAVLDVSDPARISEVTRFFTGGRFTHNAWTTTDGRYLFTTDETAAGRPLEAWDILDVRSPRKVAEYQAQAGTIPHNVMVDGNRLVVAHYTEGVHVLDVSNPERPTLIGAYDTYPGPSGGYAGVWGAYIFPGSDLIVASDLQGGLFVLRSPR